MSDIELIEYGEVDLEDSLLVVAFPTVGLVSSIAGHFIIDNLKLTIKIPKHKIEKLNNKIIYNIF